jgi:uncharacterized phage protein (TIGR02216 family)
MRFGLGRLRHSSAAFWDLTPAELAAAAGACAPPGGPPLGRAALAGLMAAHPD